MPAEGVDGRRNAELGNRSGPGAPASARPVRPDPALGEPLDLAARDRRGGRTRSDALLSARAARDPDRRPRRQSPARARGGDRRGRARPRDGGAPSAARPPRLLRTDRAERRPEPRLVDLRADHYLDGGRGALRARLRLPRAVALGAAVRSGLARARADGPDRVRAALRAEVRGLGGRGLDRLPDLVGDRQGALGPPLELTRH